MIPVKVYTFYNKEDPIRPNVCILRNDSGLQNPLRACDHCVTGPARYPVNDNISTYTILASKISSFSQSKHPNNV